MLCVSFLRSEKSTPLHWRWWRYESLEIFKIFHLKGHGTVLLFLSEPQQRWNLTSHLFGIFPTVKRSEWGAGKAGIGGWDKHLPLHTGWFLFPAKLHFWLFCWAEWRSDREAFLSSWHYRKEVSIKCILRNKQLSTTHFKCTTPLRPCN